MTPEQLKALRMAEDMLTAVLCDPEGKCCISGSMADLRIVDGALAILRHLATQPQAQPEPVAWRPCFNCSVDNEGRVTHSFGCQNDPTVFKEQAQPTPLTEQSPKVSDFPSVIAAKKVAVKQLEYYRSMMAATPKAEQAQPAPVEMSPEFTDTSRAALAWVLWHHQGGSSPIGQAMRFALGIGSTDRMSESQVAEAKRWASLTVQPCIGGDPLCPCQDGLACHYRDSGKTKAWKNG
jgi:hypothetical protein